MKQAFELNRKIFICLKEDFSEENGIITELLTKEVIVPNDKLVIRYFDGCNQTLLPEDKGNYKLIRYLDLFHLLVPQKDSNRRRDLFKYFFDWIGNDYEHLIDLKRNKNNIKNLLQLLDDNLNLCEKTIIMDYGCGTGISLEIALRYGIKLFGFDICPTMRRIAKGKGMVVWDEKEFAKQPPNTIDGAFSSYVFHLLPEDEFIYYLYKILKPGGIFVANFHKNSGKYWANGYLRKVGFKNMSTISIKQECHGLYASYIKN